MKQTVSRPSNVMVSCVQMLTAHEPPGMDELAADYADLTIPLSALEHRYDLLGDFYVGGWAMVALKRQHAAGDGRPCNGCSRLLMFDIDDRVDFAVAYVSDLCGKCLAGVPYKTYLKTPAWRVRRLGALERCHHRCQLCDDPGRLQVHHRTYENRGWERPHDLTVLCSSDHKRFHGI